MKYADLKRERDEAIARAVEAERLSRKEELDRIVEQHAIEIDHLEKLIAKKSARLLKASERLQELSASISVLATELEP